MRPGGGRSDASGLILFDDSALLAFYSQGAAALGLFLPLYLLLLQEAAGGVLAALKYGLRATGAAAAFLFLAHFCAANAVIVVPAHPLARRPAAPLHAQHTLSLLFATQQMHAVAAAALAYLGRGGGGGGVSGVSGSSGGFSGGMARLLAAQPPALTALMLAAHVALFVLARACGATRLTWTTQGAAKALYMRPPGASLAVIKGCRYFIAAVYTLTYAWHAVTYHQTTSGGVLWHAVVGALAFVGGWVHAFASWRERRRLLAEAEKDD